VSIFTHSYGFTNFGVVGESPISIDTVVEALSKLRLLDTAIARLCRDFDMIILSPRLSIGSDRVVEDIEINGDDIQASGRVLDMSVTAILKDLHRIAEYLSTRLPPSIAVPLSEKLMPVIASRLISGWLLPSVPLSLDGAHEFRGTLSLVLGFTEYLDELGWTGQSRLVEWVDKSPEIWLAKRKEAAIADVRILCFRGIQEKRLVERVETQMISKGDAIIAGNDQQDDDWGAEWEDEEEHSTKPQHPAGHEEEEDISAWGLEDDEPQEETRNQDDKRQEEVGEDGEDEADAWGWGDEDDNEAAPPTSTSKPVEPLRVNGAGGGTQSRPTERELTLKEIYTVTAVPDSIMEIIMQVVSDVDTLNQSTYAFSITCYSSMY
jgi:protein transport protein DSL1/ZW10